jgi:rod shape-determining protein MreD
MPHLEIRLVALIDTSIKLLGISMDRFKFELFQLSQMMLSMTFAFLAMAIVLPWQWVNLFWPNWLLLVMMFYSVRGQIIGAWIAAFIFGVGLDFLKSTPLGVHSFAFVVAVYITYLLGPRLIGQHVLSTWFAGLLVNGFFLMAMRLIEYQLQPAVSWSNTIVNNPLSYYAPTISGAFLWLLMRFFITKKRKRAVWHS